MSFRNRIWSAAALGVALLGGMGLFAPAAQAGYTVTLTQAGSNVVATGSGALNLNNLTFSSSANESAIIIPNLANIITGPLSLEPATVYIGVTGPIAFGSGVGTSPSSGIGNVVGISGFGHTLVVPAGYVSGTPLSDTSTFDNENFAGLGVTPGTYEWTWGTGLGDQNFTLDVVVPEPSGILLLALPFGLLMLFGVHHRRATRPA